MIRSFVCALSIAVIAGCSEPAPVPDNAATPVVATQLSRAPKPPSPKPAEDERQPAEPRSCTAEIGAAAAAQRAKVCRAVSPATRPPCNAANSCAMIEDEIARSCALWAADAGAGEPPAGCDVDPNGMQAAADVVRRYYAAIDARDYSTAWTQWGEEGRPGQTYAAFTAGFAGTRDVRVTIGELAPGDAGAGSVYQPVPVTVDATRTDGTRERFTGRYVVRRVGAIDGATPAQRRWHLDSASLKRVSAAD